MNRTTTLATIAFALISLSACNVVDTANQIKRVIPATPSAPTEGFTPAFVAPCEGAACPTPPPVFYPCVSGQAEGAIIEGAGSHICP